MTGKSNGSFATRYVADMQRMTNLLMGICTPVEAIEFLTNPQKQLNGEKPADLIAQGRTDEVESLIHEIRSGAFL